MSRFRLKSRDYIGDPKGKLHYNRHLFSAIASEYSRMSGVLSFGRDIPWKRRLVERLPELARPRCLDLACGNGDFTALVLNRYSEAEVTALDLAAPMLEIARERFAEDGRVSFVEADMNASELPEESYDLITVGYGLRNAPQIDRALKEISRLLRPEGVLAVLDFSRWNRGDFFELKLLRFWCGLWGLIRSGNADTYGYIADSLARYPARGALHRMFGEHDLDIIDSETHILGIIEAAIALKRST